jgi:hypothetical protein
MRRIDSAKRLVGERLRATQAPGPLKQRVQAVEGLRELAAAGHLREVVSAGGISTLVALLGSPAEELQADAAAALCAMAMDCNMTQEVVALGAGRAVGGILQRGHPRRSSGSSWRGCWPTWGASTA